MKLSSFNERPLAQSLRAPAIGIAISVALHALLWGMWSAESPRPEPPVTPAKVIEVALVAAPPAAAPTPRQPEVKPPPPPPPPSPPKAEKPPEKPVPRKPDKPKPKPAPKKPAQVEPARVESAAAAVAAPAAPVATAAPSEAKPAAAPAPQPYVAASYKDASLKNPPTRYPPIALERRWEGRVVLRVQVLPSGSAGEISIESSSGHEILDNATIDQVKGWHFLPARRGDQAVASWVIVPIEYKLKH